MKLRHASEAVHPDSVLRIVSAIESVADDGAVQVRLSKDRALTVQVPLEQVPWLKSLLAHRPPTGVR